MNESLTLNEIAEQRLNNWDLPKKSLNEQIEWVQENIIPRVAMAMIENDVVEEIRVVDNLYEAVVTALGDAKLPSNVPVNESIPIEQVEQIFKETCARIVVRSGSVDQFALPEDVQAPEEQQFIRMISRNSKQAAFIESWDQSIGFSEGLKMYGQAVPIPSYGEKRLAFFMFHLLQMMGNVEERRRAATNTPNFNIKQ